MDEEMQYLHNMKNYSAIKQDKFEALVGKWMQLEISLFSEIKADTQTIRFPLP